MAKPIIEYNVPKGKSCRKCKAKIVLENKCFYCLVWNKMLHYHINTPTAEAKAWPTLYGKVVAEKCDECITCGNND